MIEDKNKNQAKKQILQTRVYLVLDGDKIIRGKELASGTVLGEIKVAEGFIVQDIDRTIQSHRAKVVLSIEK